MKLIHISDLHLGKRVCGYSMQEEQKDALQQVLACAREQQVSAVLAAGDIYDKTVPSAEAVELLNWFLQEMQKLHIPLIVISGNHDSAVRLSFASELLEASQVFIAGEYAGSIPFVDLEEKGQKVRIHQLSFLKPGNVRPYTEQILTSYQEAFEEALGAAELADEGVNILMAHQFFAGSRVCDSEALIVGGLDQIGTEVLDDFDYAALGHLHSPQKAGEKGYYCGTLLKYSPSEAAQTKSMALLTIENDQIEKTTVPIVPLRDIRTLSGSYAELTARSFVRTQNPEDYYTITLTDTNLIPGAFGRLQTFYPRLMQLSCTGQTERIRYEDLEGAAEVQKKSPLDMMEDFYKEMNGKSVGPYQKQVLTDLLEELYAAR